MSFKLLFVSVTVALTPKAKNEPKNKPRLLWSAHQFWNSYTKEASKYIFLIAFERETGAVVIQMPSTPTYEVLSF